LRLFGPDIPTQLSQYFNVMTIKLAGLSRLHFGH